MARSFPLHMRLSGERTAISCFLILLLLSLVQSGSSNTSNGVKQVSLVVRHGERPPRQPYSTSPNQWQQGQGALTTTGKMHMYILGQQLRVRYKQLLGEGDGGGGGGGGGGGRLSVTSGDEPACKDSAQALLAGLVPPKGAMPFTPDATDWKLPMSPQQIRYVANSPDGVLLLQKRCPRVEEKMNYTLSSEQLKKINTVSSDLFQYISEHSGENIEDVVGASRFYDSLNSDSSNGKEIPNWAKQVYPNQLKVLDSTYRSLFTNDQESKRLRSGPLLKEITQHMSEKMKSADDQKENVHLYIVRQQMIHDLIRSLGFEELVEIDYGSCMIFELLYKEGDTWVVKVSFYNAKYLDEPKSLDIPSCGQECKYDSFIEAVQNVIPKNYNEECKTIGEA